MKLNASSEGKYLLSVPNALLSSLLVQDFCENTLIREVCAMCVWWWGGGLRGCKLQPCLAAEAAVATIAVGEQGEIREGDRASQLFNCCLSYDQTAGDTMQALVALIATFSWIVCNCFHLVYIFCLHQKSDTCLPSPYY